MPIDKYFSVGLFNAGSLGTKHDEFIVAMQRHKVDVMAINETWLRAQEEGKAPVIPGYRLRHLPRPRRARGTRDPDRGGGVGFYVRQGLSVRVCPHPPTPSVEQMWLRCTVNSVKILIGTAYRRPVQDVNIFLDGLSTSISSFSQYDKIILAGDFNIDMLNITTDKYRQLRDFVHSFSLTQIISEPTHFTNTSSTLIDIVCTDARVRTVEVDHVPTLGNHAMILVQFHIKKNKPTPRWVKYRPLNDIVLEIFNNDLNEINFDGIKMLQDVNKMIEALSDCINGLFDLHAPEKTVQIKEFKYPWITDNVKLMVRLRDEAHRRFKKTKLDAHKEYYKQLKSQVNSALFSEKQAYFNYYINKQKDPALLWKKMKQTVLRNHAEHDLPSHFTDADDINRTFLNVPGDGEASSEEISFFLQNKYSLANFVLKPIKPDTVHLILKRLKSNAKGVDQIALNMVTLCVPNIIDIITHIINESIRTNTFPNVWKLALVRPIPKITNPNTVKDLRPISLLCCLSKILERAVCDQVTQYLELNSILPTVQSGFRKEHSTATALLDVVDGILTAQDTGKGSILVLLDFSRAFDAINVELLLSKLAYYGFDDGTVRWFKSYLSNRSQIVELKRSDGITVKSCPFPVNRGVPQGSILGPILFILYCTDITKIINNCNYHIYADDLQLYLSCSPDNFEAVIQKINDDLDRVADWSSRNSLVLNPVKSKFMIIGSKKQIENIENLQPDIRIKGNSIERVREARNLGVKFDQHLRFESHLLDIIRNCFLRSKYFTIFVLT